MPKKTRIFINARYQGNGETIDEFDNWKEARTAIAEYRLTYGAGWRIWTSSRPFASWNED